MSFLNRKTRERGIGLRMKKISKEYLYNFQTFENSGTVKIGRPYPRNFAGKGNIIDSIIMVSGKM